MDLIVLSPHLDDAVFSVGGLISRTTSEGGDVQVVTFFTGAPDPGTAGRLRAFSDYGVRLQEDSEALAALRASPHWLDYQERIFREPRLRGFLSVFTTPESVDGFLDLDTMRPTIAGLLETYPRATILAPLGAGNHIDHAEVFVAAMLAMLDGEAFDRFRFYEDAYALGTKVRMAHYVTRQTMWGRRGAPDHASLRIFLMLRVVALARRGPPIWSFLPEEGRLLGWTCEPLPLGGHERAKAEAVAAYASQVKVMGGARAVEKVMRRGHRFWGGAEPLWRASPPAGE